MKIVLEDGGSVKAPKGSQRGANTKQQTRHSSRSGGFRRRKPGDSAVDDIVNSGADGAMDLPQFEDSTPPVVEVPEFPDFEPTAEGVMSVGGTDDSAPQEGFMEDAVPAMEGDPEPVPEFEGSGEPVEEIKAPSMRNLSRHSVGSEEGEVTSPRVTKQGNTQRFVMNEPKTKKSKKTKEPKKAKKEKDSTPKKGFTVNPPKEKQSKQSKGKRPKVERDVEAFENPQIITAPEPVLMQLVTLVEVVVAAALFFFGATQVGNILISNIVNGTLGG